MTLLGTHVEAQVAKCHDTLLSGTPQYSTVVEVPYRARFKFIKMYFTLFKILIFHTVASNFASRCGVAKYDNVEPSVEKVLQVTK